MNLSYKITNDLKINVYNDICLQGIIDYPKFKSKDDCEKFIKNYFQYLRDIEYKFLDYYKINKTFSYNIRVPFCSCYHNDFLGKTAWNAFMFDYCLNNFEKINSYKYLINEKDWKVNYSIYYNKFEMRYYWINEDSSEIFATYDAIIENNDISLFYFYSNVFCQYPAYHLIWWMIKKYKNININQTLHYSFINALTRYKNEINH